MQQTASLPKIDSGGIVNLPAETASAFHDRVKAERCRRSFYYFFRTFWGEIIEEDPVWNWHIKYMCWVLQNAAQRVFERKPKKHDIIINVPPGSTKSTVCSVMFPVWLWTRDMALRTICSSYSNDLSLHLSTKSRDIIKSELYQRLFPEVVVRTDMDAKGYFGTSSGGERFATSTSGTVTGIHGHFLIIDDPLNPKQAVSDTMLKECLLWYDKTFSTRKVDKRVSVTILIMQRLHMEDLTQHLIEIIDPQRLKHICLPCDTSWEIKPKKLKKYYKDGLLDTKRLDRSVLEEASKTLGPLDYAGQFGQSPRRSEGNMFLEDGVKIVTSITEPIVKTVRYWDKAATEGGSGARTAGVKLGLLASGRVIVLDVVLGRWATHKREDIILNRAHMDGISTSIVIEQEPGGSGKDCVNATIRNLMGFSAYADRPTGEKEVRAQPWSVVWNRGDVLIIKAPWNEEYVTNHLYFPRGKYKDEIDASAGAYAWMTRKKKRGGVW